MCSTRFTCEVNLSHLTHTTSHPSLAPSPHSQSAGKQEIIHTASHTGPGVLYQPVRSAACLLSPAIEVIHRTIILQLIVQQNIAACCTSTSSTRTPPPPQRGKRQKANWGKTAFDSFLSKERWAQLVYERIKLISAIVQIELDYLHGVTQIYQYHCY